VSGACSDGEDERERVGGIEREGVRGRRREIYAV